MDNIKVTEKVILECLKELDKNAVKYQKYKNYYEGKHDILKNYDMQDSRSNMKLVFNFPKKFVNNSTGFLLGKPINYISKSGNQEIIDTIDYGMSHWVKEHDINLYKQSEIYGIAWELNYIDRDGEFKATTLTPLNSYVLDDGTVERNAVMAIHKYSQRFDDNEYIDVYLDDEILTYRIVESTIKLVEKRNHIFGRVPVMSCLANTEGQSGFADIMTQCDGYNQLNSDLINEIADHRNAYLLIENASLEDEDLKQMKRAGVIQVPKDGKVSWLTKEINDSFVKNQMENIEQKIYAMSDQVDLSRDLASNTSSLAIKQKLLNLENRVAIREAILDGVIKKRLRNFFTYIKIKEGKEYDFRDVSIKYTRNLPTDLVAIADMISKVRGLPSDELLLSQLPFVESPQLELKRRQAEQDSQTIDLDKFIDDVADKNGLNDEVGE